jgi:hypothetical protein
MMVLSRRTQKLMAWWLVLTTTSMLVNIYAQGPAPDCLQYTDDQCTTTCIGCTRTAPTNILIEMCCCRPDWGCKLNPFTPNSQVSRCHRRMYFCIVETGDIRVVYECCAEPEECFEVDGAPCCEQQGVSTALCP